MHFTENVTTLLKLTWIYYHHQAARGGHVEIIQALVDHGVDINERTNFGKGESVLHLAYGFHDEDHPIIEFLLSLGAEDIGHDEEL